MPNLTRRKFTIYVVDDETVIATTLAMILRSMGMDAVSFSRPLDALEAIKQETPDLVLSDVAMPLMTGIELAIAIKEFCPDCKILLFSGEASTANYLESARDAGYQFEILTKPIHPADLLAKIRNLSPEYLVA